MASTILDRYLSGFLNNTPYREEVEISVVKIHISMRKTTKILEFIQGFTAIRAVLTRSSVVIGLSGLTIGEP